MQVIDSDMQQVNLIRGNLRCYKFPIIIFLPKLGSENQDDSLRSEHIAGARVQGGAQVPYDKLWALIIDDWLLMIMLEDHDWWWWLMIMIDG